MSNISNTEQYYEIFNGLFFHADWRMASYHSALIDCFGDKIAPRENYFLRNNYRYSYRLSLRSMESLLDLLFNANPILEDKARMMLKIKKEILEKQMLEAREKLDNGCTT